MGNTKTDWPEEEHKPAKASEKKWLEGEKESQERMSRRSSCHQEVGSISLFSGWPCDLLFYQYSEEEVIVYQFRRPCVLLPCLTRNPAWLPGGQAHVHSLGQLSPILRSSLIKRG
ncbi:PREDICTED: uncharacterized protein LOC101385905 [Odobenus rosmarus divergens]|uniref:Uncharacterized protein LOC101385905 n=1 Tax=Odobenus rosmarus divergens TaxID=9708 RepID=A0A9B0GM34_ODORO